MINGHHIVSEIAMKQRTVSAIIALSLLLAARAVQAECRPSLIGSPCAYGGVSSASQVEPGITLAAGNPVHLATGNKYQQEIDLPPNPAMRGLEVIRHYNAMDVRTSALGHGWTLSYDTRLHRMGQGWQIVQADGSRIDFPASSLAAGEIHHTGYGQLRRSDKHMDWLQPTGTAIRFDPHGHVVTVQWSNGEGIFITRHNDDGVLNGHIRTVQNVHGQRLDFHYDVAEQHVRLARVDTPLGRFDYRYDVPAKTRPRSAAGRNAPAAAAATRKPAFTSHRLTGVTRPDGMQRRYLYEPDRQSDHPYALTGIMIVSPRTGEEERISTWAYDVRGRAIESISTSTANTRHPLRIDYRREATRQRDGLTVVSNAAGGKTYFHTAIRGSRYVLTSVQGDRCFGCATPGSRAEYDDQGRLTVINGTRITRDPSGAIRQLEPAGMGWAGLRLHYDAQGRRSTWYSTATGAERMHYTELGLPARREFANGDTSAMTYDAQHRPVKLVEQHRDNRTVTRMHWNGHALTRIEHPAETETRHYDELGRVQERHISRPAPGSDEPLQIREQFRYDAHHRMTRHELPEGGSLHYDWGRGSQIKAIYWQDIRGHRHTILETVPDEPGYRFGNGLHLDTSADAAHLIRQLRLRHQDHLLWAQELSYDTQQRIATEHHYMNMPGDVSEQPQHSGWHYAYDAQSRLAGYQPITSGNTPGDTNTVWLAWQPDGSAAARKAQTSRRPVVRRDASGLASHIDDHELSYNASRRLQSVRRAGKTLVQYHHNAFGYRIRRKEADGGKTDYFYLNNQLVAEAQRGPGITRRYVYAHYVPVAMIEYSDHAPEGRYYAVHADLQGAPRLVTDQERRVRWHAEYSPLGEAAVIAGDLRLDLRLPGQVADPLTGWHDNLLRTYMPAWGHYLEPDPLGPVPGNQTFGYASQQPRRYADPMGLLLFAFDGTRQSADTRSNVWKMSQYYLDGAVHYHPGPGNSVFIDWDTLTAHQADQIIETQWKWLLFELSRPRPATDVTPIDILGFSRGAALARHFGNMISRHVHQGLFQFNDPFFGAVSACVDLRFMGLFDTVAQFGIAGSLNSNFDLNIAAAWEWVAHAVALHERRWLFPLTSAAGVTPDNVIEAPFIGAHSDIGGGVLPAAQGQPGGRGDLSNVALNWMIWQARAASVSLGDISSEHGSISQPILHDFRAAPLRTVFDSDRRVDASDGKPWLHTQDRHPRIGQSVRMQTEDLIQRNKDWRSQAGDEVGLVDMDGYAQWLHEELGWHAAPV